jgi:serine protease Do
MSRLLVLAVLLIPSLAFAQKPSREQKVLDDRKKVEAEGFWIYNDLAKAKAEAAKSGKPIVVVLRCLPCEECVKLDDDLVNTDPEIRPLLEKFVCVRIVGTNGLDLAQFQFDTDQSFAVFFLNADGTVYGRFGTRSHRTNWVGDVSLPGLANALRGAIDLHGDYPKNKAALAGKKGKALEFARPELFPTLKDKYTSKLDYEGNVVRSCIHCHQIGDARREFYRHRKEAIPESLVYPYPHPKSIGLILDPKERAKVSEVSVGSIAETAGFQAGDTITAMSGQPLLSIADVQWVLETISPEGAAVTVNVKRGAKSEMLVLNLPKDWRRAGDISWRASSWGLRRMATGGMLLEELPVEDRAKLKIDDFALRAKHVGEYGAHAAAKNAGFRKGDIITSWDGSKNFHGESEILAHGVMARKPGDKIAVEILRDGKVMKLNVPMQE